METASESSTPTSKRQLIKNPYKKSPPAKPKKPRKPRTKTAKKHKQQEEQEGEEAEHHDEGTEPTQEVGEIPQPKRSQRNITEFFKPIESWPIFAFKKYEEVQPTVASLPKAETEEKEVQDCMEPIADIDPTDEGHYAQDKDDRLASALMLVLDLIKQEENEEDDEVSRLAPEKDEKEAEVPFVEPFEEETHPAREPEFVWQPPKKRKLPPWMRLKKGEKCKPPTIRRSDRVMARLGEGIADPSKVWKP